MAATLKYWNGSAWVAKPLKYWTGSAWATKQLKYWNGSAWIGAAAGTTYLDSFNRANANLEASLVASGGWSWVHDGLIAAAGTIASNVLRCNTTNGTGSMYRVPALSSANHYVQFKAVATISEVDPFVCIRMADRNNFVGIRAGTDVVQIYRRVAGTLTSLHSNTAAGAVAINDIIRLEVSGTNWTYKKNGGTVTSGAIGDGGALAANVFAGVVMRNTVGNLCDDFEAGIL